MGWSCRADAYATMDRITEGCKKQATELTGRGIQNVYTHKGVQYIIEISRREHDDGAITGSIGKVTQGNAYGDGSCFVARAGSFRIDGDGTFSRGPAWLKALAKL